MICGIKYSTAKTIIKIYRKEGRVAKKKGKKARDDRLVRGIAKDILPPASEEPTHGIGALPCFGVVLPIPEGKSFLGKDFWGDLLSIHYAEL